LAKTGGGGGGDVIGCGAPQPVLGAADGGGIGCEADGGFMPAKGEGRKIVRFLPLGVSSLSLISLPF
jgi:hypothetical protein